MLTETVIKGERPRETKERDHEMTTLRCRRQNAEEQEGVSGESIQREITTETRILKKERSPERHHTTIQNDEMTK